MEDEIRRQLLEGLDEAQREAVITEAAPLLVVAGAGSGKTRVLTRRIAWRSANATLDAGHTLALTFTRKAAGELRSRLSALGLTTNLTAGTFHAIALAQLRRRALDLGRRPPALLESKVRILSLALREMGTDSRGDDERTEQLGAAAAEIEWAKARLLSADQYQEAARTARRVVEGFRANEIADLYRAYEQTKAHRGVLDFDDLLIDLTAELNSDADFAAAQRWRFRHLFVDELQDANGAQLALLDAWLGGRSDLFAVGDASQAIYGWNGADSSGVTKFTSRYAGATVLELAANYRSTPQLVAIATSVLPRRSGGEISSPRDDGPSPHLVAYRDEFEEADSIATAIHTQRSRGRRFSECAVLARTNAQLLVLEAALERAGIPVATRGASGFLGRAGVRDALRPIATSTQPAQFTKWRRDLTATPLPDEQRRGAPSSSRDPDVAAIVASRDASDRHALAELAAEYAELDPLPHGRGFVAFLRHGLSADPAPVAEDAVDVVTFHRAKGLEWRIVFVTGLEDGYVPIARAQSHEAVEEERRLLYVALSRAEDELYCSWAKTRTFGSQVIERQPSPYNDAIEEARARLSPRPQVGMDAARRALAESRAALSRNAE